jgi:hypothetical protein
MMVPPPAATADQPTSRVWRWRSLEWLALGGLVLAAFLIYGRYLNKDHFTASGDFPPAVSYALNYRLAVEDGQWLPRLVVIPRDVSLGLGSIDGTIPTADSPAFQYYGFLQSALAYPFLVFGVPGIKSVQWVVVLAFAGAALVLYATGRIMEARPAVAFLAAFSYITSPWLVSNFYGRGGISESLGQADLTLVMLGLALGYRQRYCGAILAVAVGIGALALSHNIFLLYGVVLCALMAISLTIYPPQAGVVSLRLQDRLRFPLAIALGGALGLAATAWQWLPAMQTLKETSFYYYGAFSEKGKIPTGLVEWSGIWGRPQVFVEPWSGVSRDFFFTIGWWTIPSILLLGLTRRSARPFAAAIVVGFLTFLLLIVFPKGIYPHLPGTFGATQFTFRLLAYLSLLGALALPLALPNLNRWIVATVLGLMIWSQLPVITYPMPPGGSTTAAQEEVYLKSAEYNAFYANSPNEQRLRYWFDGWLDADNVLNLRQRFWNRAGTWLVEDLPAATPVFLRIKGKLRTGLTQTQVFLTDISSASRPVSEKAMVASPEFDIMLQVPVVPGDLRLVADPTVQEGKRALAIRPEEVFANWGDPNSLIAASDLRLVRRGGYQRTFAVTPRPGFSRVPDPDGNFIVEIPMIYSRFLVVHQSGQRLDTTVDFNHRLNVRTTDLSADIVVEYQLPGLARLLSGLGLLGIAACLVGVMRANWKGPIPTSG